MKRVLNWKRSLPDHRDFKYEAIKPILPSLPKEVDLRPFCPPIYNQLDIESCSSQALAACYEYLQLRDLKAHVAAPEVFANTYTPVSRLFIYWNERFIEGDTSTDAGAITLKDGCDAIMKNGVCKETTWTYNDADVIPKPSAQAYTEALSHKISVYYRLNSMHDRKTCLADGFPFTLGIMVYESFMSDVVARTGVVPMPKPDEELEGGHAVCCVGYDDTKQHYLVRNSWGSTWSPKMGGYFLLPYAYVEDSNLAGDFFTIRK